LSSRRIKTVFLIVQFAGKEMAHAWVGMQFSLAAKLLGAITIALDARDRRQGIRNSVEDYGRRNTRRRYHLKFGLVQNKCQQ
jgi:hypothetical protein